MTSATIIDFAAARLARGLIAPRAWIGDLVWYWLCADEAKEMIEANVTGIDPLAGRLHIIPHKTLIGGRRVNETELSPRNAGASLGSAEWDRHSIGETGCVTIRT